MFENVTVLYGPERERYTAYEIPLLEYNAFIVNNILDTIPFHMLIDGYNVPSFVVTKAEFIIPEAIVNLAYHVSYVVNKICDNMITNKIYAANCIHEHVLFTPYSPCDVLFDELNSDDESKIPDELFTNYHYRFLDLIWNSGGDIDIREIMIDEGAHTLLDDNIFEDGVLLNKRYASYIDPNGHLNSYEPTNADALQREFDLVLESENMYKLVRDIEYAELRHNMIVDKHQYDEMSLDSEREEFMRYE